MGEKRRERRETEVEGEEKRDRLNLNRYARANGCKWSSDTCTMAAAGGHLECLR